MKWFWDRLSQDNEDDDEDFEFDPEEIEEALVAVQERIRSFLLDAQIPNYEAMVSAYGIEAESDIDREISLELSEERVSRLLPMMGLLHAFAHTLAVSALAVFGDKDLLKEGGRALARTHAVFEATVMSGLVGTLSQMEDMDLIEFLWEDE